MKVHYDSSPGCNSDGRVHFRPPTVLSPRVDVLFRGPLLGPVTRRVNK